MSYVIMNVGTEMLYRKVHYCTASYPTERGAKNACSRLNKDYGNTVQWVVMTTEEYSSGHDPLVTVVNLMSKKPCQIRRSEVGGPCDPSTERYWCM